MKFNPKGYIILLIAKCGSSSLSPPAIFLLHTDLILRGVGSHTGGLKQCSKEA